MTCVVARDISVGFRFYFKGGTTFQRLNGHIIINKFIKYDGYRFLTYALGGLHQGNDNIDTSTETRQIGVLIFVVLSIEVLNRGSQ